MNQSMRVSLVQRQAQQRKQPKTTTHTQPSHAQIPLQSHYNPETSQRLTKVRENKDEELLSEKEIEIGQWIDEGDILSDRQETFYEGVARVKHLTFLVVRTEVVGVKAVYITRSSLLQEGTDLQASQE